MSGAGRWTASRSASGRTEHIRLYQDDRALPFWEHTPFVKSNIETKAEFVLVDAPMLDALQANKEAFRSYFSNDAVVSFRNIGGDAILVAPSPIEASTDYAHLAAFLRTASASQVRALWQNVALSVSRTLADRPVWLSTSGLGVAWLHIRLDSSPKYYQHQPYKYWPAATGRDEYQ